MNPSCPIHQEQMVADKTKWGIRWRCREPECTVRQWDGSTSTPCNEETARLRRRCHELFDATWNGSGDQLFPNRSVAYAWMARILGIGTKDCHFGQFGAEKCQQAISAITKLSNYCNGAHG